MFFVDFIVGFFGIFGFLFVGTEINGDFFFGFCFYRFFFSLFLVRFFQGFFLGLGRILVVGEGFVFFYGFLVYGSLDVFGCLEVGFDGSVYLGMGQVSVFVSKVDAIFWLEELLRIVGKLVGREFSEGIYGEGIQRLAFEYRGGVYASQFFFGYLVYSSQVFQDDIYYLVVFYGYEEEGIIVYSVGGQQDVFVVGEVVVRVVDVARRSVSDGDFISDVISFLKGFIVGQNYFGSVGVMYRAERIYFVWGECWFKGDEARGFG